MPRADRVTRRVPVRAAGQRIVNHWLAPAAPGDFERARLGVPMLLIVSAASLVIGTLFMPDSYSWRTHSISESAAQGLAHAWIARLGFLCFGLAVLWLALARMREWARAAFGLHIAFALLMICAAAFSHRPWQLELAFDPREDFLHSVAATGMGFAFAFGVLARLLQRAADAPWRRALDAFALVSATAMPMLAAVSSMGGAIQRIMFLIAYLWYAVEVADLRKRVTLDV